MVLLGSPHALRETSGALYAFNVPVVAVTGRDESEDNHSAKGATDEVAEMLGKYDNLLTTVPDRAGQIRVRAGKRISQLSLTYLNTSFPRAMTVFIFLPEKIISFVSFSSQ